MSDRDSGLGTRDSAVPEQPEMVADGRPGGSAEGVQQVSRRAALRTLGTAALAGPLAVVEAQQPPPRQTHERPNQPAADTKQPAPSQPRFRFFTAREQRTVRVLADDIIPRDEHSGSASEAGVLQFLDFNLSVEETSQDTRIAWRGGLRWLDAESRRRFGAPYASATQAQRHQILDDISWPDRVNPEHRYGAAFFTRARDMIAAGFFSSAIGFKDLKYQGNTFVPEWKGCPPEALAKLGVSYDLMPGSAGSK